MIKHQTTNCIHPNCLLPATRYTGHVIRKKEQIIAGWCSDKHVPEKSPDESRPGYHGDWKPEYGIELRPEW